MKAIVFVVLLLAGGSARAELFEMSGKMVCGFAAEGGKVETLKLSIREVIEHAFDTDTATAKRLAFVYDTESSRLGFARRCDGAFLELFASNAGISSSFGETRNGKQPYAITQLLQVADWDVSAESGLVTCNFSGQADLNVDDVASAKGTCIGSLTIFTDEIGYCSLDARFAKPLKVRNDCKT